MVYKVLPQLVHSALLTNYVVAGGPLFFDAVPCGFLRFPWVSLGFLGFPWVSLGFLGFPWVSLGFLGFPWVSLGFLGFPSVVGFSCGQGVVPPRQENQKNQENIVRPGLGPCPLCFVLDYVHESLCRDFLAPACIVKMLCGKRGLLAEQGYYGTQTLLRTDFKNIGLCPGTSA